MNRLRRFLLIRARHTYSSASVEEDIWFDDVPEADLERAQLGAVTSATKEKKLTGAAYEG